MDAHVFVLKHEGGARRASDIHLVFVRANLIYRAPAIIQRPVREKNGGGENGEEAKEEHRGVSPFLSGPDSRNRHKSQRFIICVGRHTEDTIGWRTRKRRDYEKKKKETKKEGKEKYGCSRC